MAPLLVGGACAVFFGSVRASAQTTDPPPPLPAGTATTAPAAGPTDPAGAPTDPPAPSASGEPGVVQPPPPPAEVLVAGTRETRTGGSGLIIKTKQLERFEYDDPGAILRTTPGVYVRGEDGVGLRPNIGIRGASSDRSKKVALMEDGVLFAPAPYAAPAAYYFPLMTRMTSVRVLKGPSAIQYGPHTVGGAIDFVTAPIPDSGKGSLDVALGQYGYRKAHLRAGTSDEKWGVLIEGVHISSTGFKTIDVVGGDTGFTRNDWMVKVRRTLPVLAGVHQEVELKGSFGDETSNETYTGVSDEDFRKDPYRRYAATQLDQMKWVRTGLALTHRARFSPDVDIVTTVYRNDFDRTWDRVQGLRRGDLYASLSNPRSDFDRLVISQLRGESPSVGGADTLRVGPNRRIFESYGVQTSVRLRAKTGPVEHRFEYGARLHHDQVRRLHQQNGFLLDGPNLIPDGGPVETTADNTAAADALALHFLDAMTWSRLTLTVGARTETILGRFEDRFGGVEGRLSQQVFLPGASAYVEVLQNLGVFAGVHEGFTPAPPTDQKNTRPELSTNYESGVRYAPKGFRAEVVGFWNAYRNLTSLCSFSTGCANDGTEQQFDAGRARIRGLEVYGESEIALTKAWSVPGRVAFTYTDATFLSSFESGDPTFGTVTAGDSLPYVPEKQLTVGAGLEHKRGGVNVTFTYVDKMREVAGSGDIPGYLATDAFTQIDASGRYRLTRWLQVYVNGRNLTDQAQLMARRPLGARASAPRWVQAGLKVEL